MKKDLGIIFGLFLLIIVLLVFGNGFTSASFLKSGPTGQVSSSPIPSSTKVSIKNLAVNAIVSSKVSDRRKGLSMRDSLPLDQGMLFLFDIPGKQGIWMKDMRFAIDIIWLDQNKRIVDIVTDAPPQPGKSDNQLSIYLPRSDAKYVLEINAGLSSLNNLQIGDIANFSL